VRVGIRIRVRIRVRVRVRVRVRIWVRVRVLSVPSESFSKGSSSPRRIISAISS